MSRVRLVAWVVLGALANRRAGQPPPPCVPQDATCHIVDHLQIILASYVDQTKPTPQKMNGLFYAFIMCQLWTLYLEQMASASTPNSDAHNTTNCVLIDFWSKIVPSILQVMVNSKVLTETVNQHFLSLLESLLECNSTVLNQLLPLWTPILHSPLFNMASHVAQRLDACRELKPEPVRASGGGGGFGGGPPGPTGLAGPQGPQEPDPRAHRHLHRIMAKMAQLELQPHSFYFI